MKKAYCDIPDCKEEAWEEGVDICTGWTELDFQKKEYKPFEKPTIHKRDLCKKHFRKWCESTYGTFWKLPKPHNKGRK